MEMHGALQLLLLSVEGRVNPSTKQLIEDQVEGATELSGAVYRHFAYDVAYKVLYNH